MKAASAILALMVSACGSADSDPPGGEPSNASVTQAPAPSPTLRDVSDQELAQAIGTGCPTVVRSEYKGETSGQVFYAADCGANDFLVSIKTDGSTSKLECSFAEKMGTSCWKPW